MPEHKSKPVITKRKSKPIMSDEKSDPRSDMPKLKSEPEADSKLDPKPELEVHLEKEPELVLKSTLKLTLSSNVDPETQAKLEP